MKLSRNQGTEESDMSHADAGVKIPSNSGEERSILYDKGLQFKRSGSLENALQCFLGCLQDMKENINFPELPECLHNIAGVYSELGEYEKAIEFAQAEKLFYETALIRTEKDSELEQEGPIPEVIDPNAISEEAVRANEYERLSQMCLTVKKIQLALEYAGKATQLRKKVYGDSHSVTSKSLDLFTMIYAEMGKQQYSAAMSKMSDKKEPLALSDEQPRQNMEEIAEDKMTQAHKPHELLSVDQEEQSFLDDQIPGVDSLGGAQEGQIDDNKDPFQNQGIFGKTFFIYFLFTILMSVLITAVACYMLDADLTTVHSLLQQRLKFYYYYYYKSSTTHSRYM